LSIQKHTESQQQLATHVPLHMYSFVGQLISHDSHDLKLREKP